MEPELHDKIEFEIVYSCYTFDLKKRLDDLPNELFTPTEKNQIFDSLRNLTTNIISPSNGLWNKDAKKIDVLNKRREQLLESFDDPIDKNILVDRRY